MTLKNTLFETYYYVQFKSARRPFATHFKDLGKSETRLQLRVNICVEDPHFKQDLLKYLENFVYDGTGYLNPRCKDHLSYLAVFSIAIEFMHVIGCSYHSLGEQVKYDKAKLKSIISEIERKLSDLSVLPPAYNADVPVAPLTTASCAE